MDNYRKMNFWSRCWITENVKDNNQFFFFEKYLYSLFFPIIFLRCQWSIEQWIHWNELHIDKLRHRRILFISNFVVKLILLTSNTLIFPFTLFIWFIWIHNFFSDSFKFIEYYFIFSFIFFTFIEVRIWFLKKVIPLLQLWNIQRVKEWVSLISYFFTSKLITITMTITPITNKAMNNKVTRRKQTSEWNETKRKIIRFGMSEWLTVTNDNQLSTSLYNDPF